MYGIDELVISDARFLVLSEEPRMCGSDVGRITGPCQRSTMRRQFGTMMLQPVVAALDAIGDCSQPPSQRHVLGSPAAIIGAPLAMLGR